jgi:TolA-binding protein
MKAIVAPLILTYCAGGFSQQHDPVDCESLVAAFEDGGVESYTITEERLGELRDHIAQLQTCVDQINAQREELQLRESETAEMQRQIRDEIQELEIQLDSPSDG